MGEGEERVDEDVAAGSVLRLEAWGGYRCQCFDLIEGGKRRGKGGKRGEEEETHP